MRGAFGTPILGKGESVLCRESSIVPLETSMVVSYRLSIVAIARLFGHNLQLNVCDAQSTGVGHLGSKFFGGSLWSRYVMLRSAEGKHPMLTNHEIIFEEFQPM